MSESAVSILGYIRGRREEWISNETWEFIQDKKTLKIKMETSLDQNRELFKNLHMTKATEVKRSSGREKKKILQQ